MSRAANTPLSVRSAHRKTRPKCFTLHATLEGGWSGWGCKEAGRTGTKYRGPQAAESDPLVHGGGGSFPSSLSFFPLGCRHARAAHTHLPDWAEPEGGQGRRGGVMSVQAGSWLGSILSGCLCPPAHSLAHPPSLLSLGSSPGPHWLCPAGLAGG